MIEPYPLERLTELLQVVEQDERAAQLEKGLVHISTPLIPKAQPPVAPQPSPGAFHHPPMPSQPLGRLDATPGYPRPDAATAASLAAPASIVGLVRVQLGRSLHGPARPWALEGRNGLQSRLELVQVSNVGSRERHR